LRRGRVAFSSTIGNAMEDCGRSHIDGTRASYKQHLLVENRIVDDDIIILTAQIVSAHISFNEVAADHLPALIRDVYQALVKAGTETTEPPKGEPAVAVKNSMFPDRILCLDCGGSFKMLKRHIATDHQMTPDEYRNKWSLPPSYPMVTADYAARRSKLAKDSGLGRKAQMTPAPSSRGGRKKRS
jgi:predicted transcriptional regulator